MSGSLIRQKIAEITTKMLKGESLVKAIDKVNDSDTKANESLITKKNG
jgi:hypothetical protein